MPRKATASFDGYLGACSQEGHWNGQVYEVKTPTPTDGRVRHQQVLSEVSFSQNNAFLINLHGAVDDWPRARGRIQRWVREHPGGRIDVLHRHNDDELENYHGQD